MIAIKSPRVHVFLAEKGVGSRRFCEELIRKKLIRVNGSIAKLGDKVSPGDRIIYKKQIYVFKDFQSKNKIYLALNKPRIIYALILMLMEESWQYLWFSLCLKSVYFQLAGLILKALDFYYSPMMVNLQMILFIQGEKSKENILLNRKKILMKICLFLLNQV